VVTLTLLLNMARREKGIRLVDIAEDVPQQRNCRLDRGIITRAIDNGFYKRLSVVLPYLKKIYGTFDVSRWKKIVVGEASQ
jgi:hypothetical protein